MADAGSKRNAAIASVAGVLLVACVVAATVSVTKNGGGSSEGEQQLTTSTKSAHAICATTDYKDTCETSLSDANNTSNPKELIKVAFDAAMKNLSDVISHSTLLKKASKDPRTCGALDVCKQVLNDSVDDIRRSLDKVEGFGMEKMEEYSDDIKVWLSGALTNQETCLDAFQNTSGDTAEKMKKLLKFTGELTSNGLAMVTQFSDILLTLEIPGMKKRRRLLDFAEEGGGGHDDEDERRSRLLLAAASQLKPNAVVAKDGSGSFKTINGAISAIPPKNNVTYVIKIKAGIYKEQVMVPRKMKKIVFVGEGPTKTKITGSLNFIDGTATFKTATVAIQGDGFIARDIGIENSAGAAKHQAVALRVSADDAIFYNCRIDGYQDTLYTHSYRQYFRNCTITGTIDFIFGDAAAVFQNCKMIVRKPLGNQACMITAQGRKDHRGVGAIVIQNSEFLPDAALKTIKPPVTVYLGRPWKEFSRTIIMKSYIDAFIDPTGWSPWMGNFGLNTCWYAEYQNRGPGANTKARVKWKCYQKSITPEVANQFTAGVYLKGNAWIKPTGIPYNSGI